MESPQLRFIISQEDKAVSASPTLILMIDLVTPTKLEVLLNSNSNNNQSNNNSNLPTHLLTKDKRRQSKVNCQIMQMHSHQLSIVETHQVVNPTSPLAEQFENDLNIL